MDPEEEIEGLWWRFKVTNQNSVWLPRSIKSIVVAHGFWITELSGSQVVHVWASSKLDRSLKHFCGLARMPFTGASLVFPWNTDGYDPVDGLPWEIQALASAAYLSANDTSVRSITNRLQDRLTHYLRVKNAIQVVRQPDEPIAA